MEYSLSIQLLLHILTSIQCFCQCFGFWPSLKGVQQDLTLSLCISLMTYDVDIFLCAYLPHTSSSLVMYLYRSSSPFSKLVIHFIIVEF